MSKFHLIFRVHAIQRMFQRRISKKDVEQVVETGETIETYPKEKPFPSRLMLGWSGSRPYMWWWLTTVLIGKRSS